MEPLERLREAGKRMADPMESLAQRVAERVIDLVIHALDMNELIAQVDLNAALDRVDLTRLLDRVDVNRVLDRVDLSKLLERMDIPAIVDRVDVDAILQRVDMDALVSQTDLGAILAKSSSGVASNTLDAVRSQAVGLDGSIDRTVWRLVRRNTPRPVAPTLLRGQAES